MGLQFSSEPHCDKPVLLVGWPGIGNVGIIAVDGLRKAVGAEPIGEIEPWDFFYPSKATFKGGVLEEMAFPRNTFYHARHEGRDLLFFVGDEQPGIAGEGHGDDGALPQATAELPGVFVQATLRHRHPHVPQHIVRQSPGCLPVDGLVQHDRFDNLVPDGVQRAEG